MTSEKIVRKFLWRPLFLADRSTKDHRERWRWLTWANLVREIKVTGTYFLTVNGGDGSAEGITDVVYTNKSFLTFITKGNPAFVIPIEKKRYIAFSQHQSSFCEQLILSWRPRTAIGKFLEGIAWGLFLKKVSK